MKKEISTTADTQMLPAVAPQFEVAGLEGFTTKDIKVPFMILLQAMSPQTKTKHELYVEGAKEGDFMHSISQDLYQEFRLFPVSIKKRFQEWTLDAAGKEDECVREIPLPEAIKLASSLTKDDKGKLYLPNGNKLVEKWVFWSICSTSDGGVFRAGIQLKGTQIKNGKTFLSLYQMDLTSKQTVWYQATSKGESYESNSWVGWNFKAAKENGKKIPIDADTLALAQQFKEDLLSMTYDIPEESVPVQADTNVV